MRRLIQGRKTWTQIKKLWGGEKKKKKSRGSRAQSPMFRFYVLPSNKLRRPFKLVPIPSNFPYPIPLALHFLSLLMFSKLLSQLSSCPYYFSNSSTNFFHMTVQLLLSLFFFFDSILWFMFIFPLLCFLLPHYVVKGVFPPILKNFVFFS